MLTPIHAPSVEVGGGAASRKCIFLALGIASIVAVAAGAGVFFWMKRTPSELPTPQQNSNIVATAPIAAPNPVPPPDPWHGLKAGPISLEKEGDGRLVYAVGVVRNTSTRQRFGVKVDVDVLDKQGDKIGSATDYTQVMEPGKDWKFKAMVTDRKAAKVKLADIKEED